MIEFARGNDGRERKERDKERNKDMEEDMERESDNNNVPSRREEHWYALYENSG